MFDTGYDSYRQSEIQVKAATATPAQLVLMLIDGLLDELARAEGHLLARNYERKGHCVKKCMRLLGGLEVSLDQRQGGEVADNLLRLYRYCGQRLFKASLKNDVEGFRQVTALLRTVRDGWQGFASRVA